MSESDIRRIEPAEGRRVRYENGVVLDGFDDVIWSTYWERRLLDGDIVVIETPKKGK